MPFEVIEDPQAYLRDEEQSAVNIGDGGEFSGVDSPEEWDYEPEPEESFDADFVFRRQGELINISPSTFTEFSVMMPNKATQTYDPFNFEGRRYLRQVYDTSSKRTLLKCGRQVEKTVLADEWVRLDNGAPRLARGVHEGDELATMATDGSHMTTGKVTWRSDIYVKPCVEIHTRQGHIARMALTHPVRLWDEWVEAGDSKVGDRLAVVRRCGVFEDSDTHPALERIRLTAYMLGDGHFGKDYCSFTALP